MFINSISAINNLQNNTTFGNAAKDKVVRNQLKILLTQDIWAPRLKVKMPETPLEKEVLLEVLRNRLKLDTFTRLSNERFATKADVIIYNDLLEKEPENPEISEIKKRLDAIGDIPGRIKTLSREMNKELKVEENRNAMNYFKNIAQMEEDYLNTKRIKESKIEKFFTQIQKHNINPDGRYTTEELIRFIENDKAPVIDHKNQIFSKKQLLAAIESDYEKQLRENINVFGSEANSVLIRRQAQDQALSK